MGGHHHGHSHGPSGADVNSRYVAIALGLILVFMVGEVSTAFLIGSLALLADAGHMLTDAAALAATLWTLRLSRRPATSRMTFGFDRAEVLSAAANGITLLVVGALILEEAITRLVHPTAVEGSAILVVAGIGVAVNLVATLLVSRAGQGRMDVVGAVAHLATDVWAFAGTLAAGLVIVLTGFERADPIASILVVAVMAKAAVPILRQAGAVLLEGSPEGLEVEAVRRHILELTEVVEVHDLHAWVVGSALPAVSAHVVVQPECYLSGGAPRLLDQLQQCLAGHFDVEHSTFQIEPVGHSDHELSAHG